MTFSQHLSFTDFKELEIHKDTYPKNSSHQEQDNWREKYEVLTRKILKSLYSYMKSRHETNPFLPIKYAEGHTTFFIDAWKHFLSFENLPDVKDIQEVVSRVDPNVFYDHDLYRLTNPIWKAIDHTLMMKSFGNKTSKADGWEEEQLKTKYDLLVKMVEAGDLQHFCWNDDETCSECGQKLKKEMKNWQIKLITFDYELYQQKKPYLLTPKACLSDAITAIDIEFKTGNLLVADWFRIPGFSEIDNKDNAYPSINFAEGRIKRTQYFLKNFNVISVSVGNTSPEILSSSDKLMVGYFKGDTLKIKNFNLEGRVCTDFWGVTIIEKENLIEILSKTHGMKKSNELVENYLKEYGVHQVTISPGKYQLKFHGNTENFASKYKSELSEQVFEPFFTVESKTLSPKKKVKIK